MKIRILKQKVLDEIKNNLENYYSYYFTEDSNKWIFQIDKEPFSDYKDIPNFELYGLTDNASKGEVDLNNCKIIYKNLLGIVSESQAADERLWSGLEHDLFYSYMRMRWGYDKSNPKSEKETVGEIKTRYFFSGGQRVGFFRNTLAKCWWVGKSLYDENANNHFWRLDVLGANNITTKISDIFYSNKFASNKEILNGIIAVYEHYESKGIKLDHLKYMRPTLQYINAIGGGIVLDSLSSEDIKIIAIKYIDKLLKGTSDIEKNNDNYFDDNEENVDSGISKDKNNLVSKLGSIVTVRNENDNSKKEFKILKDADGNLIGIANKIINKHIGDQVIIDSNLYIIEDIRFH